MPNPKFKKNSSDIKGYWHVEGIMDAMEKELGPAKNDDLLHQAANKLWVKHRQDLEMGMEETSAKVGSLKKILQKKPEKFGTSIILINYWANYFVFMALAIEAEI